MEKNSNMPPALPWILVTPASQGIGLALTRHLLRTTRLPVVATARNDVAGARARMAEGLDVDDERLDVLELEVTGKFSMGKAPPPLPSLRCDKQAP